MATERFLLTVLPHSVDPAAKFHVSVYLTPRLTPSGHDNTLRAFPLFGAFTPTLAAHGTLVLLDQSGHRYSARRSSELEPSLWAEVFPLDTVVKGRTPPGFVGRKWKSFPTKKLDLWAKGVHALAMASSPVELPQASTTPLSTLLRTLSRRLKLSDGRDIDESRVTKALDELLAKRVTAGTGIATHAETPTAENALLDGLLDLHQARRFYDRIESVQPFMARPDPSARAKPLPRPAPDFHERLTLVNDHPELLRLLGLVVDLKVEARELDLLRKATALEAHVEWDDRRFASSQLPASQTLVAVAGSALCTVPATEDYVAGRLRLGDESRFSLLEVDPDATALKLERFVWTLPRLTLLESQNEPAHAAPPTVRATGLAVSRSGRAGLVQQRVDAAQKLDSDVAAGGVKLHTEDLLRGFRVEVWDAAAHSWYSLHQRRGTLRVGPRKTLPASTPGFVRTGSVSETSGVVDSPLYVHETLFGWEGWSLSVPYPGRALVHKDGQENFTDPSDEKTVTPVRASYEVVPGSLPRLRYGREYAFRAWTVDLAGNSSPHLLGPVTSAPPLPSLEARLHGRPLTHPSDPPWLSALRKVASTAQPGGELRMHFGGETAAPTPTEAQPSALASSPALETLLRERSLLRSSARELRSATVTRRELITRTMSGVLSNEPSLLASAAHWSASDLGLSSVHVDPIHSGLSVEALGALTLDTVTPLRPFLRWDPIAHPVLVARRRFTEGESLRQVVIRSQVTVAPDGSLVVTPWVESPSTLEDHGYRATSERHLVPPKTTQNEAERHGMFDFAIGVQDPAAHKKAFQMALRESGTLLEPTVPDLADPGRLHDQPGISVAGSNPEVKVDLKTLPRGEGLPSGCYVIHDTEQLRVPWLPDPLASGLSLVFPDANADRRIRWPLNIESVAVRYRGSWPEPTPFRLVLGHGPSLSAQVDGSAIRVELPAGETLRFRVSSTVKAGALAQLGLWRMLPEAARNNPVLREAAADGWLWALTPGEDVTLVHAVPRPTKVPRAMLLAPWRAAGSTSVSLLGAIDLDASSTGRLDVEAEWEDQVDDLNQEGPGMQKLGGHAFGLTVSSDEDPVVLWLADGATTLPGGDGVQLHKAEHVLGDSRHRLIQYRLRATTRFKEYFPASSYSDAEPPHVTSAAYTVSVPASVKPARPEVAQVLPLFRWEEGPEPAQPFAWRRTRRVGLRVYLKRPWFSSGTGEQLAVLLAPQATTKLPEGAASEWASDPVWLSRGPAFRALQMELDHFLHFGGADDRPQLAAPAGKAVLLGNTAAGATPLWVLPYQPEFVAERGLWMVDIGVRPGSSLWPFVRLVLARYQAESLPGCQLSTPVRCDFAQLPPERSFTLARPDDHTARVVVSGPPAIGKLGSVEFFRDLRDGQVSFATLTEAIGKSRRFVASLEQRQPQLDSDLAWRPLSTVTLSLEGYDPDSGHATWLGTLKLPSALPARQPGDSTDFRVTVEEIENLPADPEGPPNRLMMVGVEQRVVYADRIPL